MVDLNPYRWSDHCLLLVSYYLHSMMRILIISLTLVFVAYFLSCRSNKGWNSKVGTPITFGSYGGFAGTYKEHTINDDGLVHFKSAIKGEAQVVKNLSEDELKSIFEGVHTSKLCELKHDSPGNLTHFIKFTYADESYHLKWAAGTEIPDNLRAYFKLLRSTVKNTDPIM